MRLIRSTILALFAALTVGLAWASPASAVPDDRYFQSARVEPGHGRSRAERPRWRRSAREVRHRTAAHRPSAARRHAARSGRALRQRSGLQTSWSGSPEPRGGGWGAEQSPVVRFLADAAEAATTPLRRAAEAVVRGGRPRGAPRAWCGWWLARHLGIASRSLWLARNWAGVGSSAGGPQVGAIVVWRHHVGKITAVERGRVRVLSGNDGGAVRERWRSVASAIAFRRL